MHLFMYAMDVTVDIYVLYPRNITSQERQGHDGDKGMRRSLVLNSSEAFKFQASNE